MTQRAAQGITEVEVVVHGDVTPGAAAAAQRKIAALARYAGEPITHARVRLTHLAGPAVARPVIAQGNLRLPGRLVRAQVAGGTTREAIDLLTDRLRHRLRRLARHWGARRGWQRQQPAVRRPAYRKLPVEERELVRRKTYGPRYATAAEARADMELLDYDFYLYTDRDTGRDAVVRRTGGLPGEPVPLPVPEAVERLNLTGAPFLFFTDPDSGRGQVVYRRFDGHYGLISPAD